MRNIIIYLFLFLSIIPSVKASDISIPLTVHEALREGISGIDREMEIVTVGIPFPEGMLREINGVPQLTIEGVSDYQFRTLSKWPDGSVRWVLSDFQTDVKANSLNNKFTVIRGKGNSHGKLAEDKGDVIAINTGAMTVEVKKKGFNLFDSVSLHDKKIITSGNSRGIAAVNSEMEKYMASNDNNSEVIIEENGPVRAVIKACGTHTVNDKRLMNYTVRMHFYKNKSRVKVIYTLRNAGKAQFEHFFIHSLDLTTKISLKEPYQVAIAEHNGVIKEFLRDKDEKIAYYQAVSDFPQAFEGSAFYYHAPIPPDYKREKQYGFVQEGYWIKKNNQTIKSGKKHEYPDLAVLDLSDSEGNGVAIGIRFAAGLWPKSLRAYSDGTVEIGLWPEENNVGYWIRHGSHNTFEIMYDFHSKPLNAKDSMKKFQYPLIAKAPVEWYNKCVKGIYPLYHFVSFEDEKRFIEKRGWDYGRRAQNRMSRMKIWRYQYWGMGGYGNQHDFARINLVNFLRDTENKERSGEYFLYSEMRFNYNADWSIYHSDDYECAHCTKHGYMPQKNLEKAWIAGVTFDFEHPHWYGLSLYYYMTGDERIKDAVFDWGEILKEWYGKEWILVYPRYFGWGMYNLAAMYDFTGDNSFMKLADNLFLLLLKAKLNIEKPGQTIFINWDRGYIAGGSGSGWSKQAGLKPGLMTGYTIFDGLLNYYFNMDNSHPLRENLVNVLEGISEFMYREPYFEGKERGHHIIWLPYVYNLEDRSKSDHEYKTLRQAFYVNLMPLIFFGENRWLERIDKIIRTAAMDSPDYLDHPGVQSMLYYRLNAREDVSPPLTIEDLFAEVKGNNLILSWTVPKDAVRYQIKYSTKKLVESLEFDPDKRTYKYDLSEYANWWSGENIADEPFPEESGKKQKFIIKDLKQGHYYFAIRSLDKYNNRSRVSNLADVRIP